VQKILTKNFSSACG